jgi:hypothetical protein
MRLRAFGCAVVFVVLAGCSTTVSRDEASSAAAGQSYVLVVADGLPADTVQMNSLTFQRIDMASSKFLRQSAYVTFSHKEFAGGGDEFQKPETMAASELRYAGTKIPPGDYALVSHYVLTAVGLSKMQNFSCYSRGAAVYRFQEGAINIVRLGPSHELAIFAGKLNVVEVDPTALQADVNTVLAGYPNMTAPRVVAKLLGTARFDSGTKNQCNTSGGFSFDRAAGVSVDW